MYSAEPSLLTLPAKSAARILRRSRVLSGLVLVNGSKKRKEAVGCLPKCGGGFQIRLPYPKSHKSSVASEVIVMRSLTMYY